MHVIELTGVGNEAQVYRIDLSNWRDCDAQGHAIGACIKVGYLNFERTVAVGDWLNGSHLKTVEESVSLGWHKSSGPERHHHFELLISATAN